jgi:phosphoribosylformylglycinamidine cyclo-ligase
VFNCGVGMALVVSDPAAAIALLAEHGETAVPIGRIEAGSGEPRAEVATPPGWPG